MKERREEEKRKGADKSDDTLIGAKRSTIEKNREIVASDARNFRIDKIKKRK